MFFVKKCFIWCPLGFIFFLIAIILNSENSFSAGNPFADIFNKQLNTPIEKSTNPFADIFNKQLNKNPNPIIVSPKSSPKRHISSNEFAYLLTHKNHAVIKKLYIKSGKKIPYIDFMQAYDREHIKIKGINQTLTIDNINFVCRCGCVTRTQWNHWEPPSRYKIKTKFALTIIGGNNLYSKCTCGCNKT